MNTIKKLGIAGLAAIVLSLGAAQSSDAATRRVPSQYTTIQSALNASFEGDTILVASGNYNEDLTTANKNLLIQSESGAAATKVIGTDSNYSGINSAFYIGNTIGFFGQQTIDGFTFEKPSSHGIASGYGISASGGENSNIVIKNCVIQNCKNAGLYFYDTNIDLENNVVRDNGQGIYMSHASGKVKGNVVSNSGNDGPGIYADTHAPANDISNNTIVKNKKGGLFTNTMARYDHNIIANNNVYGLLVANSMGDNGCNDIFGNDKDFVNPSLNPIGPPNTSDIQKDPLFCNAAGNVFYLQSYSPCVAGKSCPEQIGALGVACGPTPAKPTTWGKLRNVYK